MNNLISTVLLLGTLTTLPQAVAEDGQQLFASKACMACHRLDSKLVGPSLKEVASRYTKQADAATLLAGKIKNGGQGSWGAMPMPPNKVTDDEAKILADWILQQK